MGDRYGCHVDLAEDEEPDGCVLDYGQPHDCIYATFPSGRIRKRRETCMHWRKITPTTKPRSAE